MHLYDYIYFILLQPGLKLKPYIRGPKGYEFELLFLWLWWRHMKKMEILVMSI